MGSRTSHSSWEHYKYNYIYIIISYTCTYIVYLYMYTRWEGIRKRYCIIGGIRVFKKELLRYLWISTKTKQIANEGENYSGLKKWHTNHKKIHAVRNIFSFILKSRSKTEVIVFIGSNLIWFKQRGGWTPSLWFLNFYISERLVPPGREYIWTPSTPWTRIYLSS